MQKNYLKLQSHPFLFEFVENSVIVTERLLILHILEIAMTCHKNRFKKLSPVEVKTNKICLCKMTEEKIAYEEECFQN